MEGLALLLNRRKLAGSKDSCLLTFGRADPNGSRLQFTWLAESGLYEKVQKAKKEGQDCTAK
jgi:hypothetical protein